MDSRDARRVLKLGLDLASNLAELTPTLLDDELVDMAALIVNDDEYWALAWHVISNAIGYIDRENRHLVVEADASSGALADACDMPVELLATVLQLMIEILQWWTGECQD